MQAWVWSKRRTMASRVRKGAAAGGLEATAGGVATDLPPLRVHQSGCGAATPPALWPESRLGAVGGCGGRRVLAPVLLRVRVRRRCGTLRVPAGRGPILFALPRRTGQGRA